MRLDETINEFVKLGLYFKKLSSFENEDIIYKQAFSQNTFFSKKNICHAFFSLSKLLEKENLNKWISSYSLSKKKTKSILVICAGNIPLVCFHDILCVLITGNNLILKPSHKDSVLTYFVINKLIEIQPKFSKRIVISNFNKKLSYDMVISTGSDSARKYFNYYFKKKPSIIRSNRTSIAILNGGENKKDLSSLASDVFLYFGLGCRNVTKLYIPKGYDIKQLEPYFYYYINNSSNKNYFDNYLYNKTILKLSKQKFFDFKNILLLNSVKLHPPIAVLYYEFYNKIEEINFNKDKVQCIVSNNAIQFKSTSFGECQSPKLNDYADNIDTISFLTS